MALNIKKGTEPIEITQVKILIYGQPGAGKTSLAFTASNPLCLDFDKGVHRSEFRKDSVLMKDWSEVAKIGSDVNELNGYNTIIVDGVAKCLDFLFLALMRENKKLARADGAPTMQGYGAMKIGFDKWMTKLEMLGKDIIIISHDKEITEGESRILRPDITGGSFGIITKQADFIGYVYKREGDIRSLNFNPTARTIGKNSAPFQEMGIPDFHQTPDFMADLIKVMKSSMGKSANSQIEAQNKIKESTTKYESFKTETEFTAELQQIRPLFKQNKPMALQLKAILDEIALTKGIIFHEVEKCYFLDPTLLAPVKEEAAQEQEAEASFFDDETPF